MPGPALDPARQALLDETRRLVEEVASRLEGLGVADATRKALADSCEPLALPFLLVVVGEFNAGKSAFINALLGSRVLEEGVTPTTASIIRMPNPCKASSNRTSKAVMTIAQDSGM